MGFSDSEFKGSIDAEGSSTLSLYMVSSCFISPVSLFDDSLFPSLLDIMIPKTVIVKMDNPIAGKGIPFMVLLNDDFTLLNPSLICSFMYEMVSRNESSIPDIYYTVT